MVRKEKKQGRANPPPAYGPIQLETLMAYDRDLQRKQELEGDIANIKVDDRDVGEELKKLEGTRRFLWEQLVEDKGPEEASLFKTDS